MNYAEHIFTRNYNDLRHLNTKSDAYSAIRSALILRLWLTESSSPIHLVNKSKQQGKLMFEWITGPSPFHLMDARLNRITMHSLYFNGVRAEYARDAQSGTMQTFLSTALLLWGGKNFTVKEIVKYVANNLGGAHFNVMLVHERAIEGPNLNSAPLELLFLSIKVVSDIILNSTIKSLRDVVIKYPKDTPTVSHWNAPAGKSIYMDGKNQYMQSELIDRDMSGDLFGFLLSAKILRPRSKTHNVVAHIGSEDRSSFDFKLISNRDVFVASLRLKRNKRIRLEFPDFFTNNFNSWCTVGVFLINENDSSTLILSLNGPIVAELRVDSGRIGTYYNRICIGSNVVGKQCAEMQFQEAVLISGEYKPDHIDNLINYINGNWQR